MEVGKEASSGGAKRHKPLRTLRFTKEDCDSFVSQNIPTRRVFSLYIVSRYTKHGLSRHDTIGGMRKLTLSDYQALAEFRYQIRKFLHFSERAVQAAGLERGQYQLMLAIKGMPEGVRPRIREVANRMQIQHHSAVELVNRLERGGYVQRERAQDDRREVLLALTRKGEKVLGELAVHHHEELRGRLPSWWRRYSG